MSTGSEPSDGGEWTDADDERIGYEPWCAPEDPDPITIGRLADLNARDGYDVHSSSFVSVDAHVVADRLRLGERSFIASGCLIRGDITVGKFCSMNAGAVTIGRVSIGDMVRIASYAVLVGENHVIDDLDQPIFLQGLRTEGIVIEDDVWIGTHVTVVDGVRVGAHSVLAAGAVITHDVEPWSVMAGVPARRIRDRRHGPAPNGRVRRRSDGLTRFDAALSAQWGDVLDRCRTRHEDLDTFVDHPGAARGPRPLNDAIEIAGALGEVPVGFDRRELIERIQSTQDPVTGLFVDPSVGPPAEPLAITDHEWDMYGMLSCGYALEVLGAGPLHPVHVIEHCAAHELERRLDALDWGYMAWDSGAWVDGFGTGAYLNRRHHGSANAHPMLWGWLRTHVDARSGLWGDHLGADGRWNFRWLMAVNGYYRLTRGTYAQFGVEVAHADRAIDTVLAHCRDKDWFTTSERNACNVLDVIHPLWMLSRQSDHRAAEIRAGAVRILAEATDEWVDGQGVAWDVNADVPGLQGTEMWMSIVHLAADLVGEASGLSWSPRGVHRLEPATAI